MVDVAQDRFFGLRRTDSHRRVCAGNPFGAGMSVARVERGGVRA